MALKASAYSAARRRHIYAYLSILPAILIIVLFTVYPVLYNLDLALHKNVLTAPGKHPFTGPKNFVDVLKNPGLIRSFKTTAQFTAVIVVGDVILGILIALLLNEKFLGARVLQVLILIPWAIPVVMAGIIWRWMFAGNVGVINGLLYSLGIIDKYYSFFGNPMTAKMALTVARLWKDVPLATILLLATLQVIPHELYDAAKIDGGGVWAVFRYVTFPFLRPTLTVLLILETLIGFVTFDLVYVMTGGGPADATMLLAWYTYTEIFTHLNLGRGAALAFIIALLTLVMAVFYFWALRSEEIYQ
ncbi:MAG: sugar ABC transporter permease [Chloroflexi bacterium]|nr:sugar ABC transporter permease [Chloroflexota bacterium]